MTKIIFCLLLIYGQNLKVYSQEWFEGSLVLVSGEVIVGQISLACEHDLALFQKAGSRMVYPAHKIKSIYFYDSFADINRRYVSLVSGDNIRSGHNLYEIVIAGKVDVVRRKKASALSNHTEVVDYNYFIQYNGILTPLRKFIQKVYPQLKSTSDRQLSEFIRANRLNTALPVNAIRIIEYYNSLVSTMEPMAMH